MNLYLYIPSSSAHPPSCLKGLIASELYHYCTQNNPLTFQDILSKFIYHLTERGHKLEHLIPSLKKTPYKWLLFTPLTIQGLKKKITTHYSCIVPNIIMAFNAETYDSCTTIY
jgi:hypothetical protein